jgi:hypothetical protein
MIDANHNPEPGSIQLDNQSIAVKILMPSGRMQITDKVSGVVWSTQAGGGCGTATAQNETGDYEIKFGLSGQKGVLFKTNYYMLRSLGAEDFHDVGLTGARSGDSSTAWTIRYLLSTTFPVLNCFCYVSGAAAEKVKKFQFPRGLHLPNGDGNHLYLPRNLVEFRNPDRVDLQNELWEPPNGEDHRVIGTPFFVMTRKGRGAIHSGCIGYLQHPYSFLEIRRAASGQFVTPASARLDETGKSEERPYHFRYQFVPTDELEALSWLCREQLQETFEPPMRL